MDIDIEYNDTIESSNESETSSSDNPENIKIKFKRFIKGLKEYNLTLDELNETGWHYIGGNHKQFLSHFKLLKLKYSIEYIIRNAKNYDSAQDTFCNNSNNTIVDGGEWRNCVCHEPIYNLCFIANATREEFFIIGNCCIKSFIKANTITCEECGNEHRNKIKNLCNDCKLCQECEICGSEHKNLNHNMCNKCFNKKECKECKLKFSKKNLMKKQKDVNYVTQNTVKIVIKRKILNILNINYVIHVNLKIRIRKGKIKLKLKLKLKWKLKWKLYLEKKYLQLRNV